MATFRPLVINNGNQSQLLNADSLLVGTGIDVSAAGSLSIGGATATSITIGSASTTTNFPGPVTLTGDVTTVGGTTFTTDATFEGNVTFGNANTDTVDFVAKVDSDLVFAGVSATYKIQNLANPTSAQEAATKAYTDAQVATRVSSVSASAPLASSGGTTPDISLTGTVAVTNGGTGTSTAFTAGSIVFAGASGVYSQDNAALFWDAANDRLGLGTAVPSSTLSIAEKFRVDANGRLLEYNDAAPTDGQLLIGDTAAGYFKAATLTGGTGVTISNGAGGITINATGGTVTSVNVSGGTTGLTTSGGPITTSGTITLAGTLVAANGGTGQSSYAVGDLLYAATTTSLAKLADVATGNALISGGVGVAPSWGKIGLTTHVSGTLPVTNGGTGTATQFTAGSVVFAGVSGVYAQDNAALFWDNVNDRLGLGTAVPSSTLSIAEKFRVDANGRLLEYNDAAPTDGQLLIGDTAAGYFKAATLTGGTGVSITNGAGTITIAATGLAAGTIPLTTTGLTVGDVAYISSGSTGGSAIATAVSTSRVAGFVATIGAPGTVQVTGTATANFITGLTGLAAGQPAYLSKTAGKLTNNVSAFTTGDVVAEVGLVVSVSSGTGGAGAAVVLFQPKSIVVL